VRVRDDVVGVGPADALAAGGEAAGAVAGVHECLLRGCGGVALDRVGPVEYRAPTAGAGAGGGVVGAAAGGDAAQPLQRAGRAEGAVVVGERHRHRPTLRCLHPQGVEPGQQVTQVGGGDGQPVDLTRLDRPAGQGCQGGDDLQVGGDRAPGLPGPQQQVGSHLGAQLPDRARVAVGLEQSG
jgi:hypothetical protein